MTHILQRSAKTPRVGNETVLIEGENEKRADRYLPALLKRCRLPIYELIELELKGVGKLPAATFPDTTSTVGSVRIDV